MIILEFLTLILSFNLFTSLVEGKFLRSDTLLTCMENSEFSTSYFSVYYYPYNNTAVFYIDGSSSISGKIRAEYDVVVYGLSAYNGSIDLCDLGYATICPITSGHINVEGTYKITSDLTDQLPSIAYTIPDLDAYVQVYVYASNDTDSETPLACIKAQISNGKTVQTRYAGWPIACVSGFGLIVSSFVSIMGHSATAAHIASNAASLFVYFQNLAIMAMMGVASVPPIAAAWAQNFMWTLGIIETKFMQDIFFWYVQSTGGDVTSTLDNKDVISISVQKFFRHLSKRELSVASSSGDDVLSDTNLYTTDEYDISSKTLVLRGIQRVSYLANIEISNLFLTSITFFLFVGFILLILTSIFKGVCEIMVRAKILDANKFLLFRNHWPSLIKGSLYRLFNITFPQIVLMCLWEFTQDNSAGCLAMAVIIFIVVFILIAYAAIRIVVAGVRSINTHKNSAYILFGDPKILNKYGFFYAQYKAYNFFWVPLDLFYLFIRALLIAVLQSQGKVCACLIFAIEIIHTAVLIWIRPFMDKRTNIFNIFIAVINLINSVFFLFYSNVFRQPIVVSSVAAVVYFVMNAVFALILLIFTIVTCTLALIYRNPDTRYQPIKDDRQAFIPKEDGDDYSKVEYELAELGATAMRGHDRNSMLPDSHSITDLTDELSSVTKKDTTTTKLNPFSDNNADDDSFLNMDRSDNALITHGLGEMTTDNSGSYLNPFDDRSNSSAFIGKTNYSSNRRDAL